MYNESRDIRNMIDGELNRIAVTDDKDEIIKMLGHLSLNISKYARLNMERVCESYLKKSVNDKDVTL